MRRRALIVSPTSREYELLPAAAARLGCELVFDDFAGSFFDDVLGRDRLEAAPDVVRLVEETAGRYEAAGLSAVTSGVAYPGMTAAAVVARRLGLRGPSVRSVLLCEHKYYSRLAQRALVPCATPEFGLVDPRNPRARRHDVPPLREAGKGIGYDDALFNVEFIYDARSDALHVVEVNPKIASQFTDLFEKVDGASSYRTLLQVALGEEPDFERGRGPFKLAASCVLRRFEDATVLRVPSAAEVAALRSRLPDARV